MTSDSPDLIVLVPSLRISGGVQEALRLADQLRQAGIRVRILTLWKAPKELPSDTLEIDRISHFTARRSTAALQFPILLIRISAYLRQPEARGAALMLTHFSTFPFAWLARSHRWYCFNQDMEWQFVPKGFLRNLLRRLILATSRRASVVTTNPFIDNEFARLGVQSIAQVSIWPDGFWLTREVTQHRRSIDLIMVLRKGRMKRLDLYLELLSLIRSRPDIVSTIITPDADIHAAVQGMAAKSILRPSNFEMRSLYADSRIFLSLSDTEGFGLTPLEAMGQGCVPLCRDSGGVRSYMIGSLRANLIPLSESVESIWGRIKRILSDPDLLHERSASAVDIFRSGAEHAAVDRRDALSTIVNSLISRRQ